MLRSVIAVSTLLAASTACAYAPLFVLTKVAKGNYVHLGQNVTYTTINLITTTSLISV